jgi:uncharacterized protein (TIGR02594 family)
MRRFLAALFLCLIATGVAEAKPRRHVEPIQKVECSDPNGHYRCGGGDFTGRNWDWSGENWDSPKARTSSHHPNSGVKGKRRTREPMTGREVVRHEGGFDLIARARAYIGTNPTGWSRVWCGRFMAMIAPEAARRIHNPNFARDWARLPHVSPHVGAIAVLARGRRGGHVGVVTGFDDRGNPRIVSGNHNRRVGEGIYPRSRVIAYVSAS